MEPRTHSKDFLTLFLTDTPLLDVRAPIEFEKGAFPCSFNAPLLDNEQRKIIGTRYKEEGQDSAITLGNTMATETIKQQRLQAWQAFTSAHPEGYLYCFRGGLRSRISQQWLKEFGVDYPFIEGGYKAMRTFLIEALRESLRSIPMVLVSGRTSSGKTLVLQQMQRHIDLEGLANHRGSSFGAMVSPQPSQIDFENSISIALLKQRHQHKLPVFMEDEGRLIGQRSLPPELRQAMIEEYPLVVLHTPMEERVEIAVKDYITDLFPHYQSAYGELAHSTFSDKILHNLSRIKKRLGGERYTILNGQLTEALVAMADGDSTGFAAPIQTLLSDYYDPMYDYQLSKRHGPILFEGDKQSLLEWAEVYRPQHVKKQESISV